MKMSRIVPGCCHVLESGKSALLGAPPEILKFLLRQDKQIPSTVVLPNVAYAEGSSQVSLEFLVYWKLFVDKEVIGGNRFRVIGSRPMCERVAAALRVTLFGPTRTQLKKWKLSKNRISLLENMMHYMSIKRDDGTPLDLDDIVEFVDLSDNEAVPLFPKGDVLVSGKGNNKFHLSNGDEYHDVDLNFAGEQFPVVVGRENEPETPQVLRLKLLGTYSGFDMDGPTTGVVMWVNCNGFLVDGPIGTSRYLQQLGIAKSDIVGIILSHVHDDHCTLMDMILSEQIVNIITTREIYECMLIKISNVLGESTDEIRNYLVFTEVVPGKPCNLYGAKWEFFYTAHSIPTIGFRVTVRDNAGGQQTLMHSSDTCSFEMLDDMFESGAITEKHRHRLKNLVQGNECLAMIDGGGPPIHGNPNDYRDLIDQYEDTEFLFYHVTPQNVDTDSFDIAHPGWSKTFISADNLSQSLVLKLLKTMKLLEVDDLSWVNIIFSQGSVLNVEAGQDIVCKGQKGDDFFFILAGSVEVMADDGKRMNRVALLESGDFFGEMSIIQNENKNATVRSLSSCVLYQVSGEIFLQFVEANNLKQRFEHLWSSRSLISTVRIFRNLHPHAKHEISLLASREYFSGGDIVIRQGGKSDDFYIVIRGEAEVVRRSKSKDQLHETLGAGDFFGENVAMGYSSRRNASVVAKKGRLEVFKIPGKDLRRIAEKSPVLIHELHLVMRERGVNTFPVKRRESVFP